MSLFTAAMDKYQLGENGHIENKWANGSELSDIQEQLVNEPNEVVAEKLLDTFQEYQDDITKVDFAIDIQRLKEDITKQTKNIL